MRDVLDAVQADTNAAESRRAKMRADYPEFAAVMDDLGPDARMRHIQINGVTAAGRPCPPDPESWVTVSGEFVVFACNSGRKK